MNETAIVTVGENPRLVEALIKAGARFMVFGGTAVRWHIPEREIGSNDLDMLVEPTPKSASNVIAALDSLNVVRGPSFTVERLARPGEQIVLKFPFPDLWADILTPPADFDFGAHWDRALEATIAGTYAPIRVASIPTLLLLTSNAPPEAHSEKRARRAKDVELLRKALHTSGA